MNEEIIPTEDQIESAEARGSEQESLDDVTFEPSAHVEQVGNYEQSEAVQVAFETVADNVAPTEPPVHTEDITDGKGDKRIRDPLTGKGYDGGDSGSGEDEPVLAEGSETEPDGQAPAEELTTSKTENKTASQEPETASPYLIDGNEPETRIGDKDTNLGQNVGAGLEEGSEAVKNFDPERLGPGKLPEKGRMPVGMGPRGALFPGGGKMPRGKGPGMGGSSTSGGGPPVGGPGGGGSKGKGKVTYWGKVGDSYVEGSSNDSCERETVKRSKYSEITTDGNVIVDCGDGTQYHLTWENGGPIEVSKRGMTMDGAQPMPYTGNWGGGEDPDPDKPIGGLDRESAKVFPVVGKGGGSDSGGKTPGDKDGDDDSGKFLGDPDLTGGGPDLGDPDFPDYYTPNVMEKAMAKTQVK